MTRKRITQFITFGTAAAFGLGTFFFDSLAQPSNIPTGTLAAFLILLLRGLAPSAMKPVREAIERHETQGARQ